MKVLFVSFYTDFYEQVAERLRADLESFGLAHEVVRVEDKGSWSANVRAKPRFIRDALSRHQDYDAVVWLDADARVLERPELFITIKEDIALHFRVPARFLRSQMLAAEEPLAGTMFFKRTPEVMEFLGRWADQVEVLPFGVRRPEQQVLRNLLLTSGLSVLHLPYEYSELTAAERKLPPVIQHHRLTGDRPPPLSEEQGRLLAEERRGLAKRTADGIKRRKELRKMKLKRWLGRHGKKQVRYKYQWLMRPPFPPSKQAAFSFTFDDGRVSHCEKVAPLLEEYGFRGTFYVIPGIMQRVDSIWLRPAGAQIPIAGWDRLRAISDRGHEIGNHSWSHPRFQKVVEGKGRDFQKREIFKSSHVIARELGTAWKSFAWPFHESLPNWEKAVQEVHLGARPLAFRLSYNKGEAKLGGKSLREMNAFADMIIKKQRWGIVVIHDIEGDGPYEPHNPLELDIFRKHLEYVVSKKAKLHVQTVADINAYRYQIERNEIEK